MTVFKIGNMLDGRKLQTLPDVISGSWSEVLNGVGDLECTVPLNNPDLARMLLRETATPGKTYLAAFDGDTCLQAGPIWTHDFTGDANSHLKLEAEGAWSVLNERVLLPVLAGRLPTDVTTDTRYQNVTTDPDNPWPIDTSKSYQGMVVSLIAQAQSATGGNVPFILPTEIPGENEKWWHGSDVGFVGDRIYEVTQLQNGPDVRFSPRLTTDRLGVQWVVQVGTPTQPMIYGQIEPIFNLTVAKSSVSNLRIRVEGKGLASQGFAFGGKSIGAPVVTVSTDPTLLNAGYPLYEAVDNGHTTASELATIQSYSDALVARGRKPTYTVTFDHDLAYQPYSNAINVGDFCRLRYRNHPYLGTSPAGGARFRLIARGGDAVGKRISLTFAPEVI